ncbi:uncharacterized protein LOC107371933 [Tetranychus urticae]|uniref:uncharacterized protein LOC107371933 n=1 Tax=Tetranychus urticae TaxID=32264 RepID=UPI00077BBBBB|nr:uncharacterized protein LOC107371933 [Tetranychus urticae]
MMQIDESIFESLMNYLDHGCLLLAMDSVLPMCEVADHLQIEFIKKDNIIGMSYYTGDNCWEPCGSFEEDDQIPIAVISEEHVVDVIFDCGRTGLRIDLVSQKYRWLKMFESLHTYYNKLDDFFKPKFDIEGYLRPYIQGWPGEHVDWYNNSFADHRVHAIILKDVCYNITKSLTFCVFDMVKKTTEKSKPFDGMNLTFEDLQLDSHKSNVILLIKSQKKILMFDTRNKAWTLMGQIFSEYKMMTLTSTYIPVQFI